MSITQSCPKCGHLANFKDTSAGKQTKCKKCGSQYKITTKNVDPAAPDTEDPDWESLANLERQARPKQRKSPNRASENLSYDEASLKPKFGINDILFRVTPRMILNCVACISVGLLIWSLVTGKVSLTLDYEESVARSAQAEARRIVRRFSTLKPGMSKAEVKQHLNITRAIELNSKEVRALFVSRVTDKLIKDFLLNSKEGQFCGQDISTGSPSGFEEKNLEVLSYFGEAQVYSPDSFRELFESPDQQFFLILTAS